VPHDSTTVTTTANYFVKGNISLSGFSGLSLLAKKLQHIMVMVTVSYLLYFSLYFSRGLFVIYKSAAKIDFASVRRVRSAAEEATTPETQKMKCRSIRIRTPNQT
jgi:hypothetical protein